jgi:hypothetical protein
MALNAQHTNGGVYNSLVIGAVHSSSTLLLPAVLQQLQIPKQQVAAEAKQ